MKREPNYTVESADEAPSNQELRALASLATAEFPLSSLQIATMGHGLLAALDRAYKTEAAIHGLVKSIEELERGNQ